MSTIPNFIHPSDLPNLCAYTGKEEIRVNFTEGQLIELKDELFKKVLTNATKEALIKSVVSIITDYPDPSEHWEEVTDQIMKLNTENESLKESKKSIPSLIKKINEGYEITTQKVFGIDYQDEGIMAIHSEDGALIIQRKLTAAEKQTNIHSLTRKTS